VSRLARRFAVQQLVSWGVPYGCETTWSAALVTAGLTSNAIRHGSLPGRDFRLRLLLLPAYTTVRAEVTNTRPERPPRHPVTKLAAPDAPSGRGLLIVAEYAKRWGWAVRDAYTKTIWAEARWSAVTHCRSRRQ
jgi:hypothetical protein